MGERIDVLPGRSADVMEGWLRAHPGVQIVCRDGSGAYAVREQTTRERWQQIHDLPFIEGAGRDAASTTRSWPTSPRRIARTSTSSAQSRSTSKVNSPSSVPPAIRPLRVRDTLF
ncbi:hypothetical protein [Nonomuraea sp. NPDC049784]|uniref:hypothetical protein n=1 Tax=Nonomuraea sp. NPDC049784 TaxID=3154361 RepID=UPI0033C85633